MSRFSGFRHRLASLDEVFSKEPALISFAVIGGFYSGLALMKSTITSLFKESREDRLKRLRPTLEFLETEKKDLDEISAAVNDIVDKTVYE